MKRLPPKFALALLMLLGACAAPENSSQTSATSGAEETATNDAPVQGVLGRSATADELRGMLAPDYGAPPAADVERVAVPIDGAPGRGAELPAVTIVVFSDFQCPFCSRLEPTLARLRAAYPDDLRVVFRHLPLRSHEHAQEAAELTEVAFDLGGNDAFWRVHDLLFQNQRQLERPDLLRYAAATGLDPSEVAQRLDDGTVTARVEASARMAARLSVAHRPASSTAGPWSAHRATRPSTPSSVRSWPWPRKRPAEASTAEGSTRGASRAGRRGRPAKNGPQRLRGIPSPTCAFVYPSGPSPAVGLRTLWSRSWSSPTFSAPSALAWCQPSRPCVSATETTSASSGATPPCPFIRTLGPRRWRP
ncbi:MAG: thioredoxin domain-containing protein [Deltaproteobacteria bacterium]|nr:thioredoxin domain-containing protein [Deltaproteobacteria bacterium]